MAQKIEYPKNLAPKVDDLAPEPQGEATDARWIDEIEWEYGCRSGSHSGFMRSVLAWGDEQTWTDHLAECPAPAPVRRRKAGEWLSAEQEDNHA